MTDNAAPPGTVTRRINGMISVARVTTGGDDFVEISLRRPGFRVRLALSLEDYARVSTGQAVGGDVEIRETPSKDPECSQ